MFNITFQTSAVAVGQICAMGALGFYLVRSGIIHESGLKMLSLLSVNVFFPLFIFYQIMTNFDAHKMPYWWGFPLINISLVLSGLLISFLMAARHKEPLKDEFLAVSALHNAGYIPILMVMSMSLGQWSGLIYTCIILSIIGFDTCLWSIGVWLLTRGKSSHIDLGKMINPPLISMASALALIVLFGPNIIPAVVLKPIKVIGEAAMGTAMIVIGGNLSLSSLSKMALPQVTGVVLIKLTVLPLLTLVALCFLKLNPMISFVAMLQSCMPSSITLSIIGRNYGTQKESQDFINQCIFLTHLLCMVTIPVFLGLYGKLM